MGLFERNVQLKAPLKTSSWRKVAIGTWRTAGDPSVYASVDIEVTQALAYIEKLRALTGKKVTLTHFVGKAMANMVGRHPAINCILRFGKLYPRESVDIFFQVASDMGGKDLTGTTIRNADHKSIIEIADEMQAAVDSIRKKGDPTFKKMKGTMGFLPGILVKYVLDFAGFVLYALNLWTPLLGVPKDPFGSMMITNIGSLGIESAFAPLVPYSRVPFLLTLGAVKDAPVVREGRVEVAPVIRVCVTFDHRVIDGVHTKHMAESLLKIFKNPELELGLPNQSQPFAAEQPVHAPLSTSKRTSFVPNGMQSHDAPPPLPLA